jgi:hypothetical protein
MERAPLGAVVPGETDRALRFHADPARGEDHRRGTACQTVGQERSLLHPASLHHVNSSRDRTLLSTGMSAGTGGNCNGGMGRRLGSTRAWRAPSKAALSAWTAGRKHPDGTWSPLVTGTLHARARTTGWNTAGDSELADTSGSARRQLGPTGSLRVGQSVAATAIGTPTTRFHASSQENLRRPATWNGRPRGRSFGCSTPVFRARVPDRCNGPLHNGATEAQPA